MYRFGCLDEPPADGQLHVLRQGPGNTAARAHQVVDLMDQFVRGGDVNVPHASILAMTAAAHPGCQIQHTWYLPESHNFHILMRRHLCSLSCYESGEKAARDESDDLQLEPSIQLLLRCWHKSPRRLQSAIQQKVMARSSSANCRPKLQHRLQIKKAPRTVKIAESARQPNSHGAVPAHPLTHAGKHQQCALSPARPHVESGFE